MGRRMDCGRGRMGVWGGTSRVDGRAAYRRSAAQGGRA
eukprot:CAMPEP_0174725172 /NCGR_PEP_ID=MMETSP1094-20130205/44946_1 /TAXON_ID=156173 /ORGANISM="Chrysochromulina brevifilum, Strain UTEX LB 985" /LENGTH=37 /DNA_ID= /DNA_START= /DNA_END= /DNA_ORIENTATION=